MNSLSNNDSDMGRPPENAGDILPLQRPEFKQRLKNSRPGVAGDQSG